MNREPQTTNPKKPNLIIIDTNIMVKEENYFPTYLDKTAEDKVGRWLNRNLKFLIPAGIIFSIIWVILTFTVFK